MAMLVITRGYHSAGDFVVALVALVALAKKFFASKAS